MIRLGGLFNSDLHGLLEMRYLWERPSILSGADAQWEATPIEQAIRETLRADSPATSTNKK
jgi:NAD dependent epimerase/dehydratase family protein